MPDPPHVWWTICEEPQHLILDLAMHKTYSTGALGQIYKESWKECSNLVFVRNDSLIFPE